MNTKIDPRYIDPRYIDPRYIEMCYSAKDIICDEISEGDHIFCYYDRTESIKVLSSRIIKVESQQIHASVALPSRFPREFTSEEDIKSTGLFYYQGIDFEVLPKEHWFKIYRIDQLLEMLHIETMRDMSDIIFDGTYYYVDDPLDVGLLQHIMKTKYDLFWDGIKQKFVTIV